MKLTGPLAAPPPVTFSRDERSGVRSVPVPDPALNSITSDAASLMIEAMSSSTLWMKQALACGRANESPHGTAAPADWSQTHPCAEPFSPYAYESPTLNHTGELNAAYWRRQSAANSSRNAPGSAAYPSRAAHAATWQTTRPNSCPTEHSRPPSSGSPPLSWSPQKYVFATTSTDCCDQPAGASTP